MGKCDPKPECKKPDYVHSKWEPKKKTHWWNFRKRRKAKELRVSIGPIGIKRKEKIMIEVRITNEQRVKVTLKPVTATGKPATLDGSPTWTVQQGDAKIKEADDGLSAWLISPDLPGVSEIVIEADADLGDGVEKLTTAISLVVNSATASNLGLTVSEAEDKDTPFPETTDVPATPPEEAAKSKKK